MILVFGEYEPWTRSWIPSLIAVQHFLLFSEPQLLYLQGGFCVCAGEICMTMYVKYLAQS